MVKEPGIIFDGVWKKFARGERHDSLRDLISATMRKVLGRQPSSVELDRREFWAVRDISFQVRPGEALGIIGPNGAGKSTTLKLMTRILKPTLGHSSISGRVGALIEVASGFHPDLTGRENVFLQGAIMGMRRSDTLLKFDQIVEFAGVGEFIDTPVKRYSSGMNARLGFAIAAHLDPEVMIVDEVLSVGDAAFQTKCVRHMHGMFAKGVPIVFVSHNLTAVLELCSRVIVINRGTVTFDGDPGEAIQHHRTGPRSDDTGASDQPIRVGRVEYFENGKPSFGVFQTGSEVVMRIHYEAREPVVSPHFAVDIHRGDGVHCYAVSTFHDLELGTLAGEGAVDLRFKSLALLSGAYTFSVTLNRSEGGSGPYDSQRLAYPFLMESESKASGIVGLAHQWERPL